MMFLRRPNRYWVYGSIASFIILMLYVGHSISNTTQTSLMETHKFKLTETDHASWSALVNAHHEGKTAKYLVSSAKCKIPSVDPFGSEAMVFFDPQKYVRCTEKKLLTYIRRDNNNVVTLNIAKDTISSYSNFGVTCCYSNVRRGKSKDNPDSVVDVSSCKYFESSVVVIETAVLVICKHSVTSSVVYKNIHAAIPITETVRKKTNLSNKASDPLNVLFIGVDSVSRLNLIRQMPKTLLFLKNNKWFELQGYNKIEENTFPNLMGILTGMNYTTAVKKCNPREIGQLDKCNIIWFDYDKLGYTTAYAEDEGTVNTFTFLKKGFLKQPTDYYYRPYILNAEENLKIVRVDNTEFCLGPETSGERMLNIAKDFSMTFKNHSNLGFFWMNSYSHNEFNAPSRMDGKVLQFLQDITDGGVLENSIVFFFSDHGLRFGDIRYTHTGWLEERLPFFYISLPKKFQTRYPDKVRNLQINKNRLTTPYDFYMTLQDILVLSGKNYTVKPSITCPKCKSFFEQADEERSCQDAGIEHEWCTCTNSDGDFEIDRNMSIVQKGASVILHELDNTIKACGEESRMCDSYKLEKVFSSYVTRKDNATYILIVLETMPRAVFEASISVKSKYGTLTLELQGTISRLDEYGPHSKCVNDPVLKKYCYCYSGIKRAVHSLTNLFSGGTR